MNDPILIATAGHVDHGKSTLVQVLTGTDPDRWAEEKARGITIDLGYAHTEHEGRSFSFVDVPGHEKFIHNMLAGVGSIDAVLFVIAADESIMPQTQEHARALSWLGVEQVIVVLTKIDLVDDDLLELLDEEVSDWLSSYGWKNAPRVHFSSKVPARRDKVLELLASLKKRVSPAHGTFRLSVDRVFTAQGSGTVVTGTVERGVLKSDDQVSLIPGERKGRIRQMQVHGELVKEVGPHTRAAINFGDVHYTTLTRGHLVFRGTNPYEARRVLVRLERFEDDWTPSARHVFQVHHLAARLKARMVWRHDDVALFELTSPYSFWALDRGLLRDGTPLRILAGFQVLDPAPVLTKKRQWLDALNHLPQQLDLVSWQRWFLSCNDGLMDLAHFRKRAGADLLEPTRDAVVFIDNRRFLRRELWDSKHEAFINGIKACHKRAPLYDRIPLSRMHAWFKEQGWPAPLVETMLSAATARDEVSLEGDRVKFGKHRVIWRDDALARLKKFLAPLQKSPPIIDYKGSQGDHDLFGDLATMLLWEKFLVALTPDILIDHRFLNHLIATLHQKYQGQSFSIQALKDEFQFSRKYAIPLLEYLDKTGCTRRQDDERVWIARAAPSICSDWQPPWAT